jgi:hypothetical protein
VVAFELPTNRCTNVWAPTSRCDCARKEWLKPPTAKAVKQKNKVCFIKKWLVGKYKKIISLQRNQTTDSNIIV